MFTEGYMNTFYLAYKRYSNWSAFQNFTIVWSLVTQIRKAIHYTKPFTSRFTCNIISNTIKHFTHTDQINKKIVRVKCKKISSAIRIFCFCSMFSEGKWGWNKNNCDTFIYIEALTLFIQFQTIQYNCKFPLSWLL